MCFKIIASKENMMNIDENSFCSSKFIQDKFKKKGKN